MEISFTLKKETEIFFIVKLSNFTNNIFDIPEK